MQEVTTFNNKKLTLSLDFNVHTLTTYVSPQGEDSNGELFASVVLPELASSIFSL